jgi:iron complex outermembrane receptor protein
MRFSEIEEYLKEINYPYYTSAVNMSGIIKDIRSTYIVGSELRYNPHNTANLSLNYQFDKGVLKNFQAGFISSYVGERYAGRSTRVTVANDAYKLVKLDDYLQHDIVLGYTWKSWDLKAKLSNITNAMSYNVHDDNSLNPIAPFNYSFNVQYKF